MLPEIAASSAEHWLVADAAPDVAADADTDVVDPDTDTESPKISVLEAIGNNIIYASPSIIINENIS